jgi:hypothetical protein
MARGLRWAVLCMGALCALVACDSASTRSAAPREGTGASTAGVAGVAAPPPPSSVPFHHGAFVWQRRWGAPVRQALREADTDLERIVVLGEEVEWSAGPVPSPRSTEADMRFLAELARPIGLAVRVGLPDEGWSPAVADAAVAAVGRVRARAEAGGLTPAELHLDIDVPTSRLADYATWLPRVRAAWPGVPLTITGLPTWLPEPALSDVLAEVDGWVLQVHWLHTETWTLMRETETDAAIAAASAIGRPFRVAFPTYTSYGVREEPANLARIVAKLRAAPPAALEGVIWFRLPVPGDTGTWTDAAFDAVRAGRAPARSARAWVAPSDDEAAAGTLDVRIEADGEDEVETPCVRLLWGGGPPIAADAVGASVSAARGDARWSVLGALRPGDGPRTLGWIRLAPGERVDAVDVVDRWDCLAGRNLPAAPG